LQADPYHGEKKILHIFALQKNIMHGKIAQSTPTPLKNPKI
jgi:hypothetical protein